MADGAAVKIEMPADWKSIADQLQFARSQQVRLADPDAFSMIVVNDGPMDQRHDELVAAVRRGDILMTRGWFADPANQKVKRIYEEAKKK